jgi:hypothetical protein
MSVMGYFERRTEENRMPKGTDELGIRWNGPMLSGAMSVQLRQELERFARLGPAERVWDERVNEVYARAEDYDPVARAHCGMKE